MARSDRLHASARPAVDGETRAAETAPASRPGGIAYLLQMFPKYSETFILNELLQHQRRGAPVRVLSLRLPREGRFHGCLAELEQPAEYVAESFWDKPGKTLEAVAQAARSSPAGLGRSLWHGRPRLWSGRHATLRDVWQAALVCRWAKRRGVAHVHCHFGGYAATVACLARDMGGPSYSVTLHAFDIFRNTVNAGFLRRVIARSAFCVTVSRFNADYLRDRLAADPTKVRVLYNGIPLERFGFSDAPREKGTILSVGRLIEKKGFLHLVRACRLLADQNALRRCEIVGEGPQRDALKAEIDRLNLRDRVRLVGAWPQERVAEALSRASAFALPCVAARDGNMDALPTVLLEAMAAGCPCVSTRLSGIPEIIIDGVTGRVVQPGHDADLAAALREVMTDADLARRYARAARDRAEAMFDVRKSVATLADWLDEAAGAESAISRPRSAQAPVAPSSDAGLLPGHIVAVGQEAVR